MKRENMTAAAKFRAQCQRCGRLSPVRTGFTVEKWMTAHELEHREKDRA